MINNNNNLEIENKAMNENNSMSNKAKQDRLALLWKALLDEDKNKTTGMKHSNSMRKLSKNNNNNNNNSIKSNSIIYNSQNNVQLKRGVS